MVHRILEIVISEDKTKPLDTWVVETDKWKKNCTMSFKGVSAILLPNRKNVYKFILHACSCVLTHILGDLMGKSSVLYVRPDKVWPLVSKNTILTPAETVSNESHSFRLISEFSLDKNSYYKCHRWCNHFECFQRTFSLEHQLYWFFLHRLNTTFVHNNDIKNRYLP